MADNTPQFKITVEAVDPKMRTKVTATRQFLIPSSDYRFRPLDTTQEQQFENARKLVVETVEHMAKPVLEAYFQAEEKKAEAAKPNKRTTK